MTSYLVAGITANDWTAIAAVGSVILGIGVIVGRRLGASVDKRRAAKKAADRDHHALWGSKETDDGEPAQPGLVKIVADLAKQVDKQGRDLDARLRVVEGSRS